MTDHIDETHEDGHQTPTPETDGVPQPHPTEGANPTDTPDEAAVHQPETSEDGTEQEGSSSDEDPETFPREYVEKLRAEAAENRVKAKRADDYAQRLHVALVAATGRLADPDDLPYDEAHLEDADALTAAVDDLLQRKPHLASRRVSGGVGQGATSASGSVDLAGLLRARA